MVSMLFRDPQALSSTLAVLGTLQPQAFGFLNHVETLDSASDYYLLSCPVTDWIIHCMLALPLFIESL